MEKFWGDNYFNPKEKKFTSVADDGAGAELPRCFVQFIMKPIVTLIRNIMDGQLDLVWKMLETL